MADGIENMASAGRVAIVPKGNFIFGTLYKRLDRVRFEDGIYVAKKDNTSIYPTNEEYWSFEFGISDFVSAGEKGAPDGVATLDKIGKIPIEQIPDFEIISDIEPTNQKVGYWIYDYE